jgi:hypothetical protein
MKAPMNKFSLQDQVLLAHWSLDCAQRVLGLFEQIAPNDVRPKQALETGREWVRTGVFSMSVISGASLAAHAAAREVKLVPLACFGAHACRQVVETAHVAQHAYGATYYTLKALAASNPQDAAQLVTAEFDWRALRLPSHLREEVTSRIIFQKLHATLFISIRKVPDFYRNSVLA